ncbi:MAG: hypothetical protein V1908_01905 [Candidatus Peregrinibacteria bacterium]
MRNILKKLLAVFLLMMLALFLTSCGGSGEPTTGGLQSYDGGEFTISTDPSWKIITQSEFYPEIPKETVVAFTTPEAYSGFFINVNVIREDLGQEVKSLDYARANINLSAQNLTDYQKIQEAKAEVAGQPTLIHIFQARLNPAEKLIRFVQLYATKGNYGYIVTGGMLPDTPQDIREKVGSIVTSFQLK